MAERARDLLGLVGVVPQVGRTGLLTEVGDLRLESLHAKTERMSAKVERRAAMSSEKSSSSMSAQDYREPAPGLELAG